MQILNHKTGEIIYEDEDVETMKELVEQAIKHGKSLSYANLQGVDLRAVNFDGVDLSYAQMQNALLAWTNFYKSILVNTNMSGATLSDTTDFTDANTTGLILDKKYSNLLDGSKDLQISDWW